MNNTAGRGDHVTVNPFDTVGIDHIGPFKWGTESYYVQTMIDHHTRTAEAWATLDIKTGTAWDIFYEQWICRYGAPRRLIVDNGPCFIARSFRANAAQLGVEALYTWKAHKQGNAVCESFHQFVNRGISALNAQMSVPIQTAVATVLYAYRSTPHPSLGASPFMILSGLPMRVPGAQEIDRLLGEMSPDDRDQTLKALRDEVRDEAHRISEERATKRRPVQSYVPEVGDRVIIRYNDAEASKAAVRHGAARFAPTHIPPFRVTEVLRGGVGVRVESCSNSSEVRQVSTGDLIKLEDPTSLFMTLLNDLELYRDLAGRKRMTNEQIMGNEVERAYGIAHGKRNTSKARKRPRVEALSVPVAVGMDLSVLKRTSVSGPHGRDEV